MKKNKIILTLFGILFLVYLCLYAHEFEIRTRTEFWIIPIEIAIALILIILLFLIKAKWHIKILGFLGLIVILTMGLPKTGLWQYSLRKYVKKESYKYVKFANEINRIENEKLTYISCFNEQINSLPKLDSIEIELFKETICDYLDKLDCVEVSMDKSQGKYLFVMSRFIDNGYGLLYCKNQIDIERLYEERINSLEVTSVVKVEKQWYYISFT